MSISKRQVGLILSRLDSKIDEEEVREHIAQTFIKGVTAGILVTLTVIGLLWGGMTFGYRLAKLGEAQTDSQTIKEIEP